MDPIEFRRIIYDYYIRQGRVLPWRLTHDPYRIFVSEIMLQQTQVDRVSTRYQHFVDLFPGFGSLAAASLREVLLAWQGLGYNRRALFLRRAAVRIVEEFRGVLPCSVDTLVSLPGVGKATACAIAAFAFDAPVVFVETNIRTVFIHFFFEGRTRVSDREIVPLVGSTLDRDDPRNWYYALMDYGSMLKRQGEKGHRHSTGYKRQSRFAGSDRQIRGGILRLLADGITLSEAELVRRLDESAERVGKNLRDLCAEGFLRASEEGYTIA
jgi:A/G-specific adenine glycosylase